MLDLRYPYSSGSSIAEAVLPPMEGMTWEYVSRVVETSAWSIISCTSLGCTPKARSKVAVVCGRL